VPAKIQYHNYLIAGKLRLDFGPLHLIRICSGLDYFPPDSEVQLLLVERLDRLAMDHQHAAAMIDAWIEKQTQAPKVADLVNLSTQVGISLEALPAAGCELCNGLPFVIRERGTYSYGERCTCARGQAFRRIEHTYKKSLEDNFHNEQSHTSPGMCKDVGVKSG
jgi:hypothetical protein